MRSTLFLHETLLLLTLMAADTFQHLVKRSSSQFLRAVVDNVSHGLIAFASFNVVTLPHRISWSEFHAAIVCAVLACLIDLDHFLIADSWSLQAATSLNRRPPLHASLPLISLSLFVCLLGRYFTTKDEDEGIKGINDITSGKLDLFKSDCD